MHYFNQNLEALRRFHNLTKAQVAKEFGVTDAAVTKWESGGNIKLEIIVGLQKKYGISFDDMFYNELTPTKITSLKQGEPFSNNEEIQRLKKVIGEMHLEARESERKMEVYESDMLELIKVLRLVALRIDTEGKDRPLSKETKEAFEKVEALLSGIGK